MEENRQNAESKLPIVSKILDIADTLQQPGDHTHCSKALTALAQELECRLTAVRLLEQFADTLRLLKNITTAVNESKDLTSVAQTAIQQICTALNWPCGQFYLTPPGGNETEPSVIHYQPSAPHAEHLATHLSSLRSPSLTQQILETRHACWIETMTSPTDTPIPVQACFGFPVLVDDNVVAMMLFFHTEPVPKNDAFINIAPQIGMQMGHFFERLQAQEKLARKSSVLEVTFESMEEGISMFDSELTVAAFNHRFLTLLDFPTDQFKPGMHFSEFIRYNALRGEYGEGDVEQQVRERVELAKQFKAHAFTRKRPDGSVLEIVGTPLASGGFVTTYRDVTLREKAEEELRASELKNRLLLESAGEGIYGLDLEGNATFVNPAAARMLGYQHDELIGKPMHSTVHHSHEDGTPYDQSECPIYSARHEGSIQHVSDEVLWRKDGSFFHTEYTSTPIIQDESLVGTVVMFKDITEQKLIEEQLRLAAIAFDSHEGITIVDRDGQIVQVNRAFTDITGYSRDEVIGKNPRILKSDKHSSEFYNLMWQSLLEKGHWEGEIWNKRKNNQVYPEWLSITAVHDDRNEITHYIAHFQDITERKNLEEQLSQAQKLESIGNLAAGIAHEINTPTQYVGDNTRFLKDAFSDLLTLQNDYQATLTNHPTVSEDNALLNTLDQLREDADLPYLVDEIPEAISQALDGVERITKIVSAMKEFSHPGGRDKELVDLNRILESTITVAHSELKYTAQVETHFDPDIPLIPCMAAELNQVFLNLLVNAAHAVGDACQQDPSKQGLIQLATQTQDNHVQITIQDNGTGIPESIRKKVFDPFFTTKEVGKGTGQGLAISRSVIVDKHGGDIKVDTHVTEGARFIISLPIEEATSNAHEH